jgi:CrcB protein
MGMILAVGMGGGLGALARYFVDRAIEPAWWPGFPFGIFVVNITGGLAMGLITALAALKFQMGQELRAFLTTGILVGYTTFSTFSLQSALLIERGAYAQAAAYVVGSTVLSILALFAGLWIVRAIYA